VITQPLTQTLILLSASVAVVALARRVGLPPILGYLIVGLALGPLSLGVISDSQATHALAEIGVVFLLFTLGLDFSWPRMVAMRREVFGLGLAQVVAVGGVGSVLIHWSGAEWVQAAVAGGAISMSSTAIVLHQLTDQSELNRTHGRLSFAVLLFQDLAFVPLLALATAYAAGAAEASGAQIARLLVGGVLALGVVMIVGRRLLRPLFMEIAHSRLRELFTLTVLLVVLASAWITMQVGLSMALGAFLAGMMLAETEFRHQVESAIRPFRELLLGLFFISVGMLFDIHLLLARFVLVSILLIGLLVLKVALAAAVMRTHVPSFKAVRTAIVLAGGGEFGVALLTLLLAQPGAEERSFLQPLLAAMVLSMLLSPLLIRYNRRITRMLLGERGPPIDTIEREADATTELAERDHVILCGFGRVGQNIARVLESQGFEFIAIDLDPTRIRLARQAGDPIVFGDSSDEELLRNVGLETASAVIITFANPAVSVGIVRAIRRLRADVPVLVRTQDDAGIEELSAAGATEVVPETFEASLMLVSQVLMLLHVPVARVVRTVGEIRAGRYGTLRRVFRHDNDQPLDESHAFREELRSVVLPPQAWAVGRQVKAVQERGAEVVFTAIRRQGITGRQPDATTELKEGDLVVIYGTPEALEHAEAVLLAG
jgi:monovalent cation:H+ antiporter-2, CPA2 family